MHGRKCRLRTTSLGADDSVPQVYKFCYKAYWESLQTVTDARKFTANINLLTPEKLKKLVTLAVDKAGSKKRPILPDGSFRKLFWQQQTKALLCQDLCQRHWHPLMIKWCLNLKLVSSAAYHSLQASGMSVLPSDGTLWDYSNIVKSTVGFSLAVIQQLHDEARQGQDSVPCHRQYVHKYTCM